METEPSKEGLLRQLVCAECGRQAAQGWRALFLRSLPEDQPEVGVFCPDCAEREFGSPG